MDFAHWTGNGAFGKWENDEFGSPSYVFAPGGSRPALKNHTTAASVKHSPWHQIGNLRVTATAHEDGYVQLYNSDRGLCCITPHQPLLNVFGGGIASINYADGKQALLRREALKQGTLEHVRFGLGYAEYLFRVNGADATVIHWAPDGDSPLIITDVTISNKRIKGTSKLESVSLFFPVAYWFIDMDPLCTGTGREKFGPPPVGTALAILSRDVLGPLKLTTDHKRSAFARSFNYHCEIGETIFVSPMREDAGEFVEERNCSRQMHPMSFFAKCSGEGVKAGVADSRGVFDENGALRDRALKMTGAGLAKRLFTHPVVAAFEIGMHEGSDDTAFRMVWGYGEKKKTHEWIAAEEKKELSEDVKKRSERACVFSLPGLPWVEREWKWHSDYLQSAASYDSYYRGHTVRQGSAYYYEHGLDGAPRDKALFAVPLCCINPGLAKDIIMTDLKTSRENGRMPYAMHGYGQTAGFGVHDMPSDLALSVLWALTEYVFATRDFSVLDEEFHTWPRSSGVKRTVREQASLLAGNIVAVTGIGPHGLLRIGTGDWNDPLQFLVRNRSAFKRKGESVYNTAMALYVLPRVADLISAYDASEAVCLRDFAKRLRGAFLEQWTGEWLLRAWDGVGGAIGRKHIYLEQNAWALVTGALPRDRQCKLSENIARLLDVPSKIGANILHPAKKLRFNLIPKGWDTNGGVWAAPNMLLSWGYGLSGQKELARQSLLKNTLCAHAQEYPDIWYGIWSGPDAYNAHYAENPGETYYHFTPMADYPVMNMNAHSNPLAASLKLCGIEPTARGFDICPLLPDEAFSMKTPLVSLHKKRNSFSFEYRSRAAAGEKLEFRVRDGICAARDDFALFCGVDVLEFERTSEDEIRFAVTVDGEGKLGWRIEKKS